MKCLVVTPERTVVDFEASFIAVPLFDGELGILPGHTPLVGRLGAGELRIQNGNQTQSFYIEGGFVEVLNNIVSLLTMRACAVKELNAAEAETQLAAALEAQRNANPEIAAIQWRKATESRARLRLCQKNSR